MSERNRGRKPTVSARLQEHNHVTVVLEYCPHIPVHKGKEHEMQAHTGQHGTHSKHVRVLNDGCPAMAGVLQTSAPPSPPLATTSLVRSSGVNHA